MKYYVIMLCAFFAVFEGNAQEAESEKQNDRHEIKANALYLVLGAVDVTYEYLLNEESGVGMTLFVPYDDDVIDEINYYLSPYYRFYFGKKYASGFFLEGFGMLNSTKAYFFEQVDEFNPTIDLRDKNITDFALGIGLGGKWVSNRGLLGELNLGVGRNLFQASDYNNNEFIGKVGITIGYRF